MRRWFSAGLVPVLALLLSGCPGDACEADSDCGSGERCVWARHASESDDAPSSQMCATRDFVDDKPSPETKRGYHLHSVTVGTGGANVTFTHDD